MWLEFLGNSQIFVLTHSFFFFRTPVIFLLGYLICISNVSCLFSIFDPLSLCASFWIFVNTSLLIHLFSFQLCLKCCQMIHWDLSCDYCIFQPWIFISPLTLWALPSIITWNCCTWSQQWPPDCQTQQIPDSLFYWLSHWKFLNHPYQ